MLKNRFALYLLLFFSLIINLTAATNTASVTKLEYSEDEIAYIDSVSSIINSLINDNSCTNEEKINSFEKLVNSSVKNFGHKSAATAFSIHKKGVLYHTLGYQGIQGSFDSAISQYNQALQIRIQLNRSNNIDLTSDIINGYNMIGICYSKMGDQFNSIQSLLKGLQYADSYPSKNSIYNILLKLNTQAGRTFTSIGDYDQAIKIYEGIIQYPIENKKQEDVYYINDWKINALIELSALYSNHLHNPIESMNRLAIAEEIINSHSNEDYTYYLPDLNNKKGIISLRKQEFKKANKLFKKALTSYLKLNDQFIVADLQMNLAITYLKLNILDSVEIYLNSAKDTFVGTTEEYMLASIYDNFGDLEFKRGNYLKSLEYDNLSMTYMIPGFNPKSIFTNPSLKSENTSDKMGVLISLSSKAETFKQLYMLNGNQQYLRAAYATFQLADHIIGIMRSEFQAEASRMSLASYAKPIYEQGIEASYLLYQLQPHDSLLNKAFEFAEKSKAIVLLDAVRKTNASAHVDPELIEAEKAMNLKANYFEKQAALYEQDSTNRPNFSVYDSLLYYRRQRQNVVDQIKEATPEYYSLIFDQATTSPATIQQNLSKDQAFIEYFLGDSSLYSFTFTRDKILFNKHDHPDSIKTWVNEWIKTIPSINQDFIVPAYQLFSALIEPLENLDVLPKNLIIVPDDVLNLVNFEALVTALPSQERIYFPDFKDYMIFDHIVSYAFSASTLEETQTKRHKSKKTYLGIAPTMNEGFYQQDHWFDKLDYNREEVLHAASLFPKNNVIEKRSLKDDFMKLAPTYGLIHCATHAMANNKDGDLSFITLGQDESDIIFAKELYALDLDADLVVLSACQTSAGELNRGEGIISLARSFTYAGAASVVTSLWNVREKANKEIIYDFYHLLKKGKPKDEALRSAKLNFLKNINRDNQMNAHPYFWATMVVIGDTSTLRSSLQLELIISTALLLVIVGMLFLKYQKRRTKNQTS